MRELYDEWLDSDKQTVTASGNVRAPSRIDICDMVSKAWNSIPEEMIAKSFVACGQAKNGVPEDVTCMKEGKVAAPALAEVKEFWNLKADQFDQNVTQILEPDQNEDIFIDDDSEEEVE